jgi:hypothetical protein
MTENVDMKSTSALRGSNLELSPVGLTVAADVLDNKIVSIIKPAALNVTCNT